MREVWGGRGEFGRENGSAMVRGIRAIRAQHPRCEDCGRPAGPISPNFETKRYRAWCPEHAAIRDAKKVFERHGGAIDAKRLKPYEVETLRAALRAKRALDCVRRSARAVGTQRHRHPSAEMMPKSNNSDGEK